MKSKAICDYIARCRIGNVIVRDESVPLSEEFHWHRCRWCGTIWEHTNQLRMPMFDILPFDMTGILFPCLDDITETMHDCPRCGREERIKYRGLVMDDCLGVVEVHLKAQYTRMWRWASKGVFATIGRREELTNGIPR